MMTNLTVLPFSQPKDSRDNSSIITTLENFLDQAKNGEIDSFSFCLLMKDGNIAIGSELAIELSALSVLGAMEMLKTWYIDKRILGGD